MPRAWLLLFSVFVLGLGGPTQASGSGQRRSGGSALPTPAQVAAANRYASSRAGIVSFTVVDSRGKRYSRAGDRQFISASVSKAMLLACFLNIKAIAHQPLTATDRSELRAMITLSDNKAADEIYEAVGDVHLYNLAHRLGMRHFTVSGYWGYAQLTTNDQALLMKKLNKAVYRPYYAYARSLLSSIVSWESWGIPEVARRGGWKVLFKGGWRRTDRGSLIHQVARLERRGQVIVICIMTDGDPSSVYGQATVRGIAQRLLR
jgi:hypothetical protein